MTVTTSEAATTGVPDLRRARSSVRLVLSASFVVFADVTIVALVAPVIQQDLGATVTDIALTIAGYQVAYAATLITGGRLGDIFGRRTMFTIAFIAFVMTSAACGLAGSPGQLIAFRVLQGIAAALLTPQVLATIQIVLPPEHRAGAFAALSVVLSLASITGPVLAGLLVSANILGWGWRPIFLINIPVGLVSIALGLRLVPTFRNPAAKRLDPIGVGLVVLLLVSLMTPLSLGRVYHWPLWTWILLGAVPFLAAAFIWSQRYLYSRGRDPLLPPSLARDRAFRIGVVLYPTVYSGGIAFYLYFSLVLQAGFGLTPLWVAVSKIPSGIAAIVVSAMTARLLRRWSGRHLAAVGAAGCFIGFLAMLPAVVWTRDWTLAVWTLPGQVLVGVGFGLVVAPLLGVVLAGIRSTDAGAASGLLSTAQLAGVALGVTTTGMLFQSRLPANVTSATPAQLSDALTDCRVYTLVVFALSVVLIAILPRAVPKQPAGA
jgi:EmrB/QacA subfamily drug resistance transporter